MIKYTANSLLATMISFANEIGNLCANVGNIDVVEVMQGVHLDKRLTPIMPGGNRIVPAFTTYLEAGCGFGGSCFPKDVKALTAYGSKVGSPMQLLEAVIAINHQQPNQVLKLLKKHFPVLTGVKVAVLGVAFKPGTDDIRESPSLPVLQSLIEENASVKVYDPVAQQVAQQHFREHPLIFCEGLSQAIEDVQAVILMTRWSEFQQLPNLFAMMAEPPVVIDGRRMLDKQLIANYEGIGL